MSCQPGAPVVTVLGKVGGFSINESVQTLNYKYDYGIFHISGKCNASISDIEISFDNGITFSPLSTYAISSTNDCSTTGKFSYKIDPSAVDEFDIPETAAYLDFKIRGNGDYGLSEVFNLRRMVKSNLQVTPGSYARRQISGGVIYSHWGRLLSSAVVTNNGNYQFKGTVRIK